MHMHIAVLTVQIEPLRAKLAYTYAPTTSRHAPKINTIARMRASNLAHAPSGLSRLGLPKYNG